MERRYRETGSDMTKQEYGDIYEYHTVSCLQWTVSEAESLAVTIADKNIAELTSMSVKNL